ncbi:MAG: L,D-transpeptidase family protein [Gammaproteobacteria bacterium]|nr:L,D-transpeptidase family protein [Gammaproteobacteria bacterium]
MTRPIETGHPLRHAHAWLLPALCALVWLAPVGAVTAQTFPLPPDGGDVVGEIQTVVANEDDSLSDIARRFHIGYEEIVRANPDVDPWLPRAGTVVTVPTQYILPASPRTGIVLNVSELRLYYYPPAAAGARTVVTHPVSVGDMDWSTPLGLTQVAAKVARPTWYPPKSIRAEHAADGDPLPAAVPPGPDNPLGEYALRLGFDGYLIHGTNKPNGIGMRVTHGCVRLYPEDIEALFRSVPVGTPVRIVDQPYKAGWRDGVLLLESHPPFADSKQASPNNLTPAVQAILAATGKKSIPVDWARALDAAGAARGIPEPVSPPASTARHADDGQNKTP